MDFTHLHLHTEYSLLDGACRLKQLISAIKEQGQTAVAITDHGVMYGAVDFYKEAKKQGIKPIIGCEVYVAPRSRFDKVHELDSELMHLVLLCENNTGYQNLIELVSRGFTEGFYFKPRIDKELLEQHHEGLIALSACLAGEIPRQLSRGNFDAAKDTALWFDKVFGHGNFFIELQNHGIDEQIRILPQLIAIGKQTGIPLVATNDTHYIQKSDSKVQKVLICIQTNHTVEDEGGLEFETDEFYLKSPQEMVQLFESTPEAIENTMKIADRCNVEIEFGNTRLPLFDIGDRDHFEYFKEMCDAGLRRHYGDRPDDAVTQRLEYELGVIRQMGYIDYFLIVQDFVNYAKKSGIPVGPGRGSGAGSLAAYCIGITGIDPIRHNLLFERFLNPERVSMPDFDIDFCYVRRQEVIDYVVEKYGTDHVAQIITFGTMAARAAIRDVARALAVPYAVADKTAKLIPMEMQMTINKALSSSPELKELYDSDNMVHELIDMAQKVEGMPRHASTHAAGVVITRDKVSDYVPLAKNDEAVVTQYTMTTLEELGLLKMDFLGLRNLTVINDACHMIQKYEPDFKIEEIPLDDKKVYDMLTLGHTDGVFQFESGGMRHVLTTLKPDSIEDLIAVISLYRPGPMESIPKYIKNRHSKGKISYLTPQLEPILNVTYGCLVYQEQVMQVFRELAGYSYGRADIVRRAMSKKKHDVMERERKAFIYGAVDENGKIECEGAVKRGVDEKIANQIFDEMSSFASYAFNKSHAAAYAYVAYQTAYLKCHYKKEYMAALLTSVLDSSGKVSTYIAECFRLNIRVLPPHVNESMKGFSTGDNVIRFGLLAVKNLGNGLIDSLILERKQNGTYQSFFDFCSRLYGKDLNRRALESLIKCGAMDGLNANRRQMLHSVELVLGMLEARRRNNIDGQLGFFETMEDTGTGEEYELPELAEFPERELLNMEKETTGLYLSGHPMVAYTALAERIGAARISDVSAAGDDACEYKDGQKITLLVQVAAMKLKTTKSDQTMAFLTAEDRYGSINVLVFPKTLSRFSLLIKPDAVLIIEGKITVREDREPEIICEEIRTAEQAEISGENAQKAKPSARSGLYIKVPSLESEEYRRAAAVMAVFEGQTPVYIVCSETGKRLAAPRSKWVEPNIPMMKELKNILGEDNIKMLQ